MYWSRMRPMTRERSAERVRRRMAEVAVWLWEGGRKARGLRGGGGGAGGGVWVGGDGGAVLCLFGTGRECGGRGGVVGRGRGWALVRGGRGGSWGSGG